MDLKILTEGEGGAAGSAGGSTAAALSGLDQYAGAKMKLDELFLFWLSQDETRGLIQSYLVDLKNGRSLDIPTATLSGALVSCRRARRGIARDVLFHRLPRCLGALYGPTPAGTTRLTLCNHQLTRPSSRMRAGCGPLGASVRSTAIVPTNPHLTTRHPLAPTATFLAGKQAAANAPVSPLRGKNSPPPRSPSRSPVGGAKHFTFGEDGPGSPLDLGSPKKEAHSGSPMRPVSLSFPEGKEAPGAGTEADASASSSGPEEASPSESKPKDAGDDAAMVPADAAAAATEAASGAAATAAQGSSALPPKPATTESPRKGVRAPTADVPTFYVPGEGGRGRGRPMEDEALEQKLDLVIEVWRATNAGRPANATPEKQAPPKFEGAAAGDGTTQKPPAGYEWCEGMCVKTVDLDIGLRVEQFAAVAKTLCGFPSFFAAPLFRRIRKLLPDASEAAAKQASDSKKEAASEGKDRAESKAGGKESEAEGGKTDAADDDDDEGEIKLRTFFRYWRQEMQPYDHVDRFFRLVKQVGSPGIVKSDLLPFMEELLAFHPGLAFLENTPEFQEKYARTVIARIFYVLDPTNRRVITQRALRRSNLLAAFHTVDMEEDINLVNEFFSYEHFYVLYCKFWELDKDHDFLLSREDLTPLGGHALTNAVLDRLFEQAARPFESDDPEHRMGYEDFICLLLSEEDKTNEVAIRFWFNVIDLDGDGVIRPWEMRHFYAEQMQRMEDLNCEVVPFEDVCCQMADLLKPEVDGEFRLEHFLNPERVRLTGVFFSVLFNLSKFTAFEQRDPFVVKQQQDPGFTAWDRYAQIEYARLALEEENQDDDLSLEADEGTGLGGWGGDDDDDMRGSAGSTESPF